MANYGKAYTKPSLRSVSLTPDELKRIRDAADPKAELTRIALLHLQQGREPARISKVA